ncbi:transcription repressor OFP12-like, partial [Phalaenopsis equestris]
AADHDLISSAIASRRLFPASPGPSNSILDSSTVIIRLGSAGVAVATYTPNPYVDFRQSMEEMAAAIGVSGRGTQIDLAVLRELLFCYLELNRKQAHKYILSAFADLLFSLFSEEKGFGGHE